MSCCPDPIKIKVGSPAEPVSSIESDEMKGGESTECYTSTASNPTGQMNDATENVPNKIENATIPLNAKAEVDVTFKLQVHTDNTILGSWTFVDAETGALWDSGTGVSFNGLTGKLVGTFIGSTHGKTFKFLLTALDASGGEIHSRSYVFSPALSTAGDSIRLQHPLPGAVVTSRFNPTRLHPVTKVVKPHQGTDFAYGAGKIGDVLAAADGVCMKPQYQASGAGNYVKIVHKNSAGKHMCTTVYMHMETVYVTEGQQVSAGTKIGREGNTGIGTGAHLHFEVRLPNEARVDPEPLIAGTVMMAMETNPDNTAKGALVPSSANAVLTPSNVDAKVQGCQSYGSEYPVPEKPLGNPVAAPPGTGSQTLADPFDAAWALTMKTECVGWGSTPPTLQSTIDGEIDTSKKKLLCGYVDDPHDSGGETKFGVSQRNNKNVVVRALTYSAARDVGYSSYWAPSQSSSISGTHPRTSIALFNFGYLCGIGGAKSIASTAGISSKTDLNALDALCDAAAAYLAAIVQRNSSQKKFAQGWANRVELVRSYCKALT